MWLAGWSQDGHRRSGTGWKRHHRSAPPSRETAGQRTEASPTTRRNTGRSRLIIPGSWVRSPPGPREPSGFHGVASQLPQRRPAVSSIAVANEMHRRSVRGHNMVTTWSQDFEYVGGFHPVGGRKPRRNIGRPEAPVGPPHVRGWSRVGGRRWLTAQARSVLLTLRPVPLARERGRG